MTRFYSEPARETDTYALPDAETFRAGYGECQDCGTTVVTFDERAALCPDCSRGTAKTEDQGWFYWYCFPGCLPEGGPMGPYRTETAAIQAARDESEGG